MNVMLITKRTTQILYIHPKFYYHYI